MRLPLCSASSTSAERRAFAVAREAFFIVTNMTSLPWAGKGQPGAR